MNQVQSKNTNQKKEEIKKVVLMWPENIYLKYLLNKNSFNFNQISGIMKNLSKRI